MVIKDSYSYIDKKEALIILSYIMDKSIPFLQFNDRLILSKDEEKKFIDVVEKRKSGLPLQYAIGVWNFYGYDFFVEEDVLIPRPETELLVERVLMEDTKGKRLLDMCSGSGNIGITLSLEGDFDEVYLADISSSAINLAKKNKEKLKARVNIVRSDLFENIEGRFDFFTANPPYISGKDYDVLSSDLKREPRLALYGGEDGLFFYKKIIQDLDKYLNENAKVFFEIGYDQGKSVSSLLREKSFKDIEVVKDYNGFDRIVLAERK